MKYLTLIRHAKSSWSDPDCADIDRPLNRRGKADAPEMGRRLAAAGVKPDLLLSSPAKRARRTSRAILREMPGEIPLSIEHSLYMADVDDLLALIRSLGDSLGHVALVSHNPGLTELTNAFGASAIENVPTAGVVRFELDVNTWSETRPGIARLIDFDYPKRR